MVSSISWLLYWKPCIFSSVLIADDFTKQKEEHLPPGTFTGKMCSCHQIGFIPAWPESQSSSQCDQTDVFHLLLACSHRKTTLFHRDSVLLSCKCCVFQTLKLFITVYCVHGALYQCICSLICIRCVFCCLGHAELRKNRGKYKKLEL